MKTGIRTLYARSGFGLGFRQGLGNWAVRNELGGLGGTQH